MAVGVGLGEGSVTLFVILVRHVTVAPPPLPEPLHWFTETRPAGVVVESEETLQRTRRVPPPPFPESLHWSTAASVVFAGKGSHRTVGAVPPPIPDALHWFTVALVEVALALMLLVTSTEHVTVPPPPLPEPLHWSTEVTAELEVVVEEVQTMVAGAFAAP